MCSAKMEKQGRGAQMMSLGCAMPRILRCSAMCPAVSAMCLSRMFQVSSSLRHSQGTPNGHPGHTPGCLPLMLSTKMADLKHR